MSNIWDYVNAVTHSKKDIWESTSEAEYDNFTMNRAISMYVDTVLYAQEMNRYPDIAKKLNFDYYINSLRPMKRYSKWPKKQKDDDLEAVKAYYGYNVLKRTDKSNLSQIKVLPFKEKNEWTLVQKYSIGVKK